MRPWNRFTGALGIFAIPSLLLVPANARTPVRHPGSYPACIARAARAVRPAAPAHEAHTAKAVPVKAVPVKAVPVKAVPVKAVPVKAAARPAGVDPSFVSSHFPNVMVRSVPASPAAGTGSAANSGSAIIFRPAGATEPLRVPLPAESRASVKPETIQLSDGTVIEATRPEQVSYLVAVPGKGGPVLQCPDVASGAPAPEKASAATATAPAKEGGR